MNELDKLVESLQRYYETSSSLREAWAYESQFLVQILTELSRVLEGRYLLEDVLGVGGSGVVLRALDLSLEAPRALKFSRPSPGKQAMLARFLSAETESLMSLAHPNLMRIFARGKAVVGNETYPYYVMEMFEGVEDYDDFVARKTTSGTQVFSLTEGVLDAIAYMHAAGRVHMDLKPGNILVTPQGRPIISDLGFTKVLRSEEGLTLIGGTEGYMHPEARAAIDAASSDPNRIRGEIEIAALKPAWDLYALGKTLFVILRAIEERLDAPLTRYEFRYLKLMACRLLDGHNQSSEAILGLTAYTMGELRYTSTEEALQDLRKMTGGYSIDAVIPELNPYVAETIQASTFATTPFTLRVKSVVEHPLVLRLGGFTQLSLLNLVYPTATHTRLEHVIGCFSAMIRYLNALYHDPLNPLFRQVMNEEDIKAAMLTALLHDLGHYPLAHDLEEANREAFSHEARGHALLMDASQGLQALIEAESLDDGREPGWGVPTSRILSILNADPYGGSGTLKDRIIHTLIDGPIDADKLDYLVRDSANLGLTYGRVIDVEHFLRCLTIVTKNLGVSDYAALGIHEKGRVTAESLTFARYALYGSVYWHHAYRGVKAMIQRMAWEYLELVAESDKTRKEGVDKTVRRDLDDFLGRPTGTPQLLPLVAGSVGGQIHPGERAVLEWLGEKSGAKGKSLGSLIEKRALFKRILVVSRWGQEDLWRDISAIFASEDDWRRKLRFQRAVQREILEQVERQDLPDNQPSIAIADARNRFIVAGRQRDDILLLVDATADRSGSRRGLELVEEEDRRRAKVDELPVANPGRSAVWDALRANLQESIGKVRLFCHPDHRRFLETHLDRQKLEQALQRALGKV